LKRFLLIAALAALASSAHAGLLVAPNANAGANGNAVSFIPLGETASGWTFQWQFPAAQLASMVGDTITAIGFRLPGGISSIAAGVTEASWDLELSGAANSIGSLSPTFANNIGAGATTVYNNSLTLPAMTGGAGPNPFFLISFTTPYTYTGGDLLMTLVTGIASQSVEIDANAPDSNGDTVGASMPGATTGRAEFYNYPITEFQFTATAAPEPGTVALFLTGGLALCGLYRRRIKP
jgi:hypothetical protein